ncbi:hypothetical protein OIU74_001894 [Salix koriyanagi]|uniref:Secreted protein n=1 Tax=Salix koriyanagi TaxID=2511006 RepID=A0A9Q0X3D9_9ROSI|nr:hypothetical protein OIU74_001894 [Salix koriyanagi]
MWKQDSPGFWVFWALLWAFRGWPELVVRARPLGRQPSLLGLPSQGSFLGLGSSMGSSKGPLAKSLSPSGLQFWAWAAAPEFKQCRITAQTLGACCAASWMGCVGKPNGLQDLARLFFFFDLRVVPSLGL